MSDPYLTVPYQVFLLLVEFVAPVSVRSAESVLKTGSGCLWGRVYIPTNVWKLACSYYEGT